MPSSRSLLEPVQRRLPTAVGSNKTFRRRILSLRTVEIRPLFSQTCTARIQKFPDGSGSPQMFPDVSRCFQMCPEVSRGV
eukprot:jgi/Chrzof1/8817/Cz03g25190.t1